MATRIRSRRIPSTQNLYDLFQCSWYVLGRNGFLPRENSRPLSMASFSMENRAFYRSTFVGKQFMKYLKTVNLRCASCSRVTLVDRCRLAEFLPMIRASFASLASFPSGHHVDQVYQPFTQGQEQGVASAAHLFPDNLFVPILAQICACPISSRIQSQMKHKVVVILLDQYTRRFLQ